MWLSRSTRHPPRRTLREIEDTIEHQKQIFMALRDENRCLASEASAYSHYRRGQRERRQRLHKGGDLVLVRNLAVDGQRERKLESKLLGPRLLISLSSSGLTGRVRELYGEGNTKRYHLNDLIFYVERKDFEVETAKCWWCGDAEQSVMHLYTKCRKWRPERRTLKKILGKAGIQWQRRPEKRWLAELLAKKHAVGSLEGGKRIRRGRKNGGVEAKEGSGGGRPVRRLIAPA